MNWKSISLGVLGVVIMAGCNPGGRVKQEQAMTVKETERVKTSYTGPRRRIGVVDFDNKTKYGAARLGNSASDILITELAKTGKFIVVEREKMGKLIEEQKLGSTGAIDPNTAAKMGRILGLNAIVTGSVSQFGTQTGGSEYLLAQSKKQTAKAIVDIRVVDVDTGRILLADSGQGIAQRKSGGVLGLGTRAGYDETIEGDALRAAIVKFVDNIVNQVNARPWSCRVAMVDADQIFLNAGDASGLKKDTVLDLFHLGREIIDPTTGVSMGNVETYIGKVKVVRSFGEDGSVAKLTDGTLPSVNDIARLKE